MSEALIPKGKKNSFFLLSLFFIFTSDSFAQNQQSRRHANQLYMVSRVLGKYHYKPQQLNDDLSIRLNKELIKALDPTGIYFTKNDIVRLNEFEKSLDEEISNSSTDYLRMVTHLYKSSLVRADSIIDALGAKPFNFTEKDTMFYGRKDSEVKYAADEKALAKRWNKWLKYQTLELLYTPVDKAEDPFTKEVKELLKKEPEARAKVVSRYKRSIDRVLGHSDGFENNISSVYINTFISLYDPHSSFFSASEKQEFESSVSRDELTFGFYFDENDKGEIEVVNLTPGGSAWKSNQLHKGDVILKVLPEQGKLIDLTAVSSEEAIELMSSFKTNEAQFTIRKTNGLVKEVVLIKSKVVSEENIVKSYILNGEKKIGYISLPSFYTEWDSNNPLGCANDVAKEIVKLQEENIEGLVMDLRYNGGGSAQEAMALLGLFINEGPLCIYKVRNEKPILLKDMNRGTAFDGPLVIMINGLSASASEIFAGTLQDYNRALLVGNTSYGKATGQIIIPLDTLYSLPEVLSGALSNKQSDLGYLKVTTQGFYRVTNATHQKKGVAADINLLEPYFYSDYKEAAEPYALANDSIVKKVVYAPLNALPLNELKTKSVQRVAAAKSFSRLSLINDSLKLTSDHETAVPLTPAAFSKSLKFLQHLRDEMEGNMTDSSVSFKVNNHLYDKKFIVFDEFTKEINERSLENLQNDIYIDEVYLILKDLITFTQN